jgi:hypothetical protein
MNTKEIENGIRKNLEAAMGSETPTPSFTTWDDPPESYPYMLYFRDYKLSGGVIHRYYIVDSFNESIYDNIEITKEIYKFLKAENVDITKIINPEKTIEMMKKLESKKYFDSKIDEIVSFGYTKTSAQKAYSASKNVDAALEAARWTDENKDSIISDDRVQNKMLSRMIYTISKYHPNERIREVWERLGLPELPPAGFHFTTAFLRAVSVLLSA